MGPPALGLRAPTFQMWGDISTMIRSTIDNNSIIMTFWLTIHTQLFEVDIAINNSWHCDQQWTTILSTVGDNSIIQYPHMCLCRRKDNKALMCAIKNFLIQSEKNQHRQNVFVSFENGQHLTRFRSKNTYWKLAILFQTEAETLKKEFF
jgi:hypothetical protein